MKVIVTKNILYYGYSVQLQFEGKTFPTFFQGSKDEAEIYASRIRKSVHRSGTKKRLTSVSRFDSI